MNKSTPVQPINYRIYGPICMAVFFGLFFYGRLAVDPANIPARAVNSLLYALLCWESGRWLLLSCRKKMPAVYHARKRIVLTIVLGLPLAALVAFGNQLLLLWMGQLSLLSVQDYFFIAGLHMLGWSVVFGMYEKDYYLQEWKLLAGESENLKKQNSNCRFQFLREQIKPHFLFNSLNTLSALIITDPVKAELYVEEMSTVYRYLLSKNEKELTTLKEELSFLDSYLLLLRVRFEKSLNVCINTHEQMQEYFLPPFVLQLLIENAVKHNIISGEHPLTIKIFTDAEGSLQVENNLQLKARPDVSEQTGLANIRSRYALLNREAGFKVMSSDCFFKVTVPLIKINRHRVAHLLKD